MMRGFGEKKLIIGRNAVLFLFALFSSLLLVNHYVWAIDATGLALTVVSDDTSGISGDSTTTNGTVPVTGGQITYRWGWTNVPGGGNAVFSQTLPAGVSWNAASVALGCSVTGSYLTTGETLTCTISNLTDIPGTTDKIATVRNMTGAQTITTKLTSGSQQSSTVSLTTASTSQIQGVIGRGSTTYMTDAKDPATGAISGLQVPFSMGFYVTGNATDQIKGQETLGNSVGMSYTVTVPANAQLIGCGTASQYQHDSNFSSMPTFGTGAGTGTARVSNSGSISCSQSGTTVTINATGIDGKLTQVPTGSAYYPQRGYFALHGMYLWMPSTAFNSSTATNVNTTLNSYTLTSGGGIESSSTVANAAYPITLPAFTLNSSATVSNSTPYAGVNYNQNSTLSVPAGSGQSATNAQICSVWNPTLQKIRGDITPLTYSGTNVTGLQASNFTIEYGTASYADDVARRNADCGIVGDNAANWFSSVSAAGGPSEVSAVRIRYNRTLDPSQTVTMNIAVTSPTSPSLIPNISTPTGSTTLPFFNNRKSDQTAAQKLTSGNSSSATLSMASVRNVINFPASDVKPGATTNVTLTPTVSTGSTVADARSAVGVTETVTLPNGCFTFVPGTPAPVSVTPAVPATPGVGQTCAQVAGQVVVWNLGNVSTTGGTSPINFAVNINPAAPTPSIVTITGAIASNSDKVSSGTRTSTDTINVNTVNQFQISLTSSSANVNTGIPFTYRAGWKNASTSDLAGGAYVVDVLPYVGDGRGTTGLDNLTLNSVTTNPGGLQIEYTTDNATTVRSQLVGDNSGSTGITWTTTKPGSDITAVRARTQDLIAGASGYMDISVTPVNFIKGAKMSNDLTAKADDLTSGFSGTEDIELNSSSSTVNGSVYQDVDYSGAKNAGDAVIDNKVVTITGYNFGPDGINNAGNGDDIGLPGGTTTNTDSSGNFSFTVSPGIYTLAVSSTNTISGNVSNLITQPAANFEVSGGATVNNKNFGYQEPISPPVARDDNSTTNSSLTLNQGAQVTIPVLSNDDTYVPAGVPATTISNPTTPDRGTATLNGDKTITYVANSVWPGSVSGLSYTATFQYTITNPQGSSTATVTMLVKRLPFATTDNIEIKDGQTVDIDVLANDYGDTISFNDGNSPTTNGSGTVSVPLDKIHFIPASHSWSTNETSYTEAVTYHIQDIASNYATGTVNITVYRPPVVTNDSRTIAYNTPTSIDVRANDLVGKAPATLSIVSQPSTGSVSVSGNNILFTPTSTQSGVTTFVYALTDGLGQVTNGTATISVADQFTVANDGSGGFPIRSAQAGKTIDVLANDTGSSLSIDSISTTPSHGIATIVSGKVTYIPTASYSGTDSFTYTAKDVLNTTKIATVFVRVIASPLPVNDTEWTDTSSPKDFDVIANDAHDSSSTITITSAPVLGTASVVGGKIRYIPAGIGTATLTYRVSDDVSQSATATLTITIVSPLSIQDNGSLGTPIRIAAVGETIDVLANDTGTSLTIDSVSTPAHGTTVIQSGKIRYIPAAGYGGADQFTYVAKDSVGQTQTATAYIFAVVAPVVANDTGSTNSDTSIDVDVLANDTYDASAIITIETQASHGSAMIVAGKIRYIPGINDEGNRTVTYKITDNKNQSSTGTVTITVSAAFVARDDGSQSAPLLLTKSDGSISVLTNDSGIGLTITSVSTPAHGSVVIHALATSVIYTPTTGFYGTDNFTYTMQDTHGQSQTATVYVVVNKEDIPKTTTDSNTNNTAQASERTIPLSFIESDTTAAAEGSPSTLNDTTSSNGTVILLNNFDTYPKNEGKKLAMKSQQVVYFDVTQKTQKERHSVTLQAIGDGFVDIIIASTPKRDRLAIGETKRYDVTNDGINDIEVTLNGITDSIADIRFKQLFAKIANETEVSPNVSGFNWWWLLLLLVPLTASYSYARYRSQMNRRR